jgi:hypothetical protein
MMRRIALRKCRPADSGILTLGLCNPNMRKHRNKNNSDQSPNGEHVKLPSWRNDPYCMKLYFNKVFKPFDRRSA